MIQIGQAFSLSFLLFMTPAPASTVEWLSGHELENACDELLDDARNRSGVLCLAFIQGFIAGGDTAGSKAAAGAGTSRSADETYAERAARMRLGTLRLQQIQATDRYCIDDSIEALEVVRKVRAYLGDRPGASDLTAHDAIREALIHNFPCTE